MEVNIVPKEYVVVKLITNIDIITTSLILNTSAQFLVYSKTESGEIVKTDTVVVSGQAYQDWITDEYIIDYICQQLGYTPLPATIRKL